MKNYKFVTIIFFVLLMGCGFKSVLNDNSINFSIENVIPSGNKNINDNILSSLVNYINNPEKEKKYYLKINSIENRNVTSKDTKGDPKTFRIEIRTMIEVSNINNEIYKKNFIEKKNYNTMSSKFDLGLYENNIRKDLASIIARNISIYLSSLN
tara:strand:- start:1149 stop:1610 length:462 start_codon:yes stop_codon:yes gene_type:complete